MIHIEQSSILFLLPKIDYLHLYLTILVNLRFCYYKTFLRLLPSNYQEYNNHTL